MTTDPGLISLFTDPQKRKQGEKEKEEIPRKMTWEEKEKEEEPRRSSSSSPDRPSRKAEVEDKYLTRTQHLEDQKRKLRESMDRKKEKLW